MTLSHYLNRRWLITYGASFSSSTWRHFHVTWYSSSKVGWKLFSTVFPIGLWVMVRRHMNDVIRRSSWNLDLVSLQIDSGHHAHFVVTGGIMTVFKTLINATPQIISHDDVIKWKHSPLYWPLVRGIHRSSVNSPHKGQWRWALCFLWSAHE